ncbi:hypothetical protein L1D44_03130 [Shewanella sp. Isolate13]|uniref:hypothetical protein n=1 Tax=Shewanella sp. Isolate13 TaxID=2908531 RepID=UPI001EFE19E3|nr:hypothetical protein [Shewanella sp. Isolate13]MCG9728850.1 hypothetical protein [Shewanella sp. Isolate13]
MSSEQTINEQEILQSWLTVIVMLTVFWSPIERYVDQCVSILFEFGKGKKKPLTLSHKLGFIQKELTELDFTDDDLISLIKATKSTVQIRDICVHVVIDSFDSNELKISKVQGKAEKYAIEMFTITSERLNKSANNLMRLNAHWGALVENLNERLKCS